MISLRQLRYFQALAAVRHFGRAAEEAGISQPALSMQLRDLEKDLGGPLVERNPAGARLTGLGEEVARLLGVMDRRLNDHPWLAGEHFSIADIASYAWTKAILAALAKAEPDREPGVPAVEAWLQAVGDRPAVQRGMAVPQV